MVQPLSQFVLKVHSRCDLACDHCYVYEAADDGWRRQPRTMSDETVRAVTRRIAEHATAHGVDVVRVVLHGGEPLLVGREGLRRICGELAAGLASVAKVELTMQTNGVLLDEDFCEVLSALGVRVGVSLDGGRAANDRHRRFAHGGGSYDHVARAVRLLGTPAYRHIFAGLLCTVDVANDPVEVFDDLAAFGPPVIDLLLPHATWEQPPPGAVPGETPYGDWLAAVFDHWYAQPPRVGVRLFEEIVHALLGGASTSEAAGLSPPASVVIETDGSVEQTDALKIAYNGAPATGLTVFDHPLDDVLHHPAVAARQAGLRGLCAQCQSCPIVAACGGGLYAHRYRRATGFGNPSVYCADMMRLVGHIRSRLQADLDRLPELVRRSA